MTRKQKSKLLVIAWLLFVALLFLIAATKGFALSAHHKRQHKIAQPVDDFYVKYGYTHGDLVAVYTDRTHDYDDTVIVIEDATKVFDLDTVTLCGGEYTQHRFKGLIGKTVLIAYSRTISNTANKCHELIGILPTEQGQ